MTSQAANKQRIQVPDSLRDLLLEFSISYLLEQPGDVIDYAVEFFTKLQENRKSAVASSGDAVSPDESIMDTDEGEYISFFCVYCVLVYGFFECCCATWEEQQGATMDGRESFAR